MPHAIQTDHITAGRGDVCGLVEGGRFEVGTLQVRKESQSCIVDTTREAGEVSLAIDDIAER